MVIWISCTWTFYRGICNSFFFKDCLEASQKIPTIFSSHSSFPKKITRSLLNTTPLFPVESRNLEFWLEININYQSFRIPHQSNNNNINVLVFSCKNYYCWTILGASRKVTITIPSFLKWSNFKWLIEMFNHRNKILQKNWNLFIKSFYKIQIRLRP